jgi:hypothetical protein
MNNRDFKVHIFGYGGAWDYTEGQPAFYVQCKDHKPVLVDCGSTVHPKLLKLLNSTQRVIDENHIIITHTHEDHVGSLSNNVYYRYFQALIRNAKATTKIIATKAVKGLVNQKLLMINNHKPEQFEFKEQGIFEELGMSIGMIDTTGQHFEGYPTSGVIMRSASGEFLVISGDINIPIFPLIKEQFPDSFKEMEANPKNVMVLHDVTAFDYPDNPHCFYKLLIDYKKKYPYIYAYHHDKGQMEALNQTGWVNFCGDYLDREIKVG